MQGATHRAGGVTAALTGFLVAQSQGSPLISAAPLASMLVVYPFALWGSTASDLDHHPGSVWDEVKLAGKRSGHTLPSQDPVSRTISHVLHSTRGIRNKFPKRSLASNLFGVLDCKHRSWQTHSEVPAILLVLALGLYPNPSDLSSAIFSLVITGVLLGILAHLVLDLLTPEGLPFASGIFINRIILRKKVLPEKIKIVPHVSPKPAAPGKTQEPGFFSTGGKWEKKFIYNLLRLVNLILFGYIIWKHFIDPYVDLDALVSMFKIK